MIRSVVAYAASLASAVAVLPMGLCGGSSSLPDLSECAEGEAVVQCTYQEDFTYPACPNDDVSSPWAGECVWREEFGLYGRSDWVYPACPTSEVCVPVDELDDLRVAIEDGDFSAWCYADQRADVSDWEEMPGEPGPQPCTTRSVTWAPQDEDGALDL